MIEQNKVEYILQRVLDYAKSEDYAGYNKFDALNSPVLKRLSLKSKWLRFAFIQAVMRSPLNLRSVLGIPKTINPKGIALFAMAHLNEYARSKSESSLQQAQHCLNWLIQNGVEGAHGMGWGYNFDWQSTLFLAPQYSPNAIVTVLCGEAFVKAFEVLGDEKYRHYAERAARFLRHDLPVLHESADELCVAYVTYPVESVVLNINASAGAQLAKVGRLCADESLLNDARRMISFVANRSTSYYAWYYTYPAQHSYIVHDNYHTGGIVDALRDYEIYADDVAFHDVYTKALDYYAHELFLTDGAPKYMNNRTFPFDIHGSAQGIISFAKASYWNKSYLQLASRIAKWAIDNMFDAKHGFFYYQKGRFLTKRFTLMRWCNAWMAKALSDLLLAYKLINELKLNN
jgi:hypothetical protein